MKEYRVKNKAKIKAQKTKWNQDNKEKQQAYFKKYKQDNREAIRDLNDKWVENNNEQHKKNRREYFKQRRQEPLLKAQGRLQALIRASLVARGYRKQSKSAHILGGDFETVWNHLRKTWYDRYRYELKDTDAYDIHHIIYCKTANNKEELMKLQHYTNLTLLTPSDHRKLHRQFK